MLRSYLLLLGAAALLLTPVVAEEMNLVKLHVDSFSVIGFETRTSNARESSGDGPLAKLWVRFRDENYLVQIPNRVDDRVVAVYSDYESDKDGPYSYLLGAKVSSTKDIPPGMTSRTVVSGPYAMFTVQGGPPAQILLGLWKHIWSLEKADQLHRAYKTDYEVYYDGILTNPNNARVDVYVGLRGK